MLSARVGQYFKWVGQSPEWVGHGLPGLGLEPPLSTALKHFVKIRKVAVKIHRGRPIVIIVRHANVLCISGDVDHLHVHHRRDKCSLSDTLANT